MLRKEGKRRIKALKGSGTRAKKKEQRDEQRSLSIRCHR
jgi:hypothetical protein